MNLKKVMAAGTMAFVLAGTVLNVSAAEKTSNDYLDAWKESGKESLIIDVEAYKAAYGDLEEAFGDDVNAYLEHYLTSGIYEGRTKGVLFNPLVYAEAYKDIKEAYGSNILAIVDHYVTYGVMENRTAGTANGYADIAAAQKAGVRMTAAPKISSAESNAYGSGSADNSYDSSTIAGSSYASSAEGSSYSSAPAGSYASSAAETSNSGNAAGRSNSVDDGKTYHHTTSIYHDDGETLWRVEYYDENNNLFEYSDVTNFDSSTNSYTEDIYDKNNVLQRTDTYVNGTLSSSTKP